MAKNGSNIFRFVWFLPIAAADSTGPTRRRHEKGRRTSIVHKIVYPDRFPIPARDDVQRDARRDRFWRPRAIIIFGAVWSVNAETRLNFFFFFRRTRSTVDVVLGPLTCPRNSGKFSGCRLVFEYNTMIVSKWNETFIGTVDGFGKKIPPRTDPPARDDFEFVPRLNSFHRKYLLFFKKKPTGWRESTFSDRFKRNTVPSTSVDDCHKRRNTPEPKSFRTKSPPTSANFFLDGTRNPPTVFFFNLPTVHKKKNKNIYYL